MDKYKNIIPGFRRTDNQPLEADTVFTTLAAAESYAAGVTSYEGQIITVKNVPYLVNKDKKLSILPTPTLEVKTRGHIVYVRHGKIGSDAVIVLLRKNRKSINRNEISVRRGGNAYRMTEIESADGRFPVMFTTSNTEDWYPIAENFCEKLPFIIRWDGGPIGHSISYSGLRINQINVATGILSMYAKIALQIAIPIHGDYETKFNSTGFIRVGNMVKMKHRVWLNQEENSMYEAVSVE